MFVLLVASAAAVPHQLGAELGFAHWFGETWGSPDGFTTPELTISAQPGVGFLEVTARYTRSLGELPGTHGTSPGIGYASLGLLLEHELRVGAQCVTLYAGPEVLLHHDAEGGTRLGGGGAIGVRYLFDLGPVAHLGPVLTVHEVFYTLPGEDRALFEDPRRDAQVDLGVTVRAF